MQWVSDILIWSCELGSLNWTIHQSYIMWFFYSIILNISCNSSCYFLPAEVAPVLYSFGSTSHISVTLYAIFRHLPTDQCLFSTSQTSIHPDEQGISCSRILCPVISALKATILQESFLSKVPPFWKIIWNPRFSWSVFYPSLWLAIYS